MGPATSRLIPRLTRKILAYRLHKARNLAVVTLDGRNYYLRAFGSPETKDEYDRVVREWSANDRFAPPAKADAHAKADPGLTIDELVLRYWRFAEGYYIRDGQVGGEVGNIKDALRPLRKLYGPTPALAKGQRRGRRVPASSASLASRRFNLPGFRASIRHHSAIHPEP